MPLRPGLCGTSLPSEPCSSNRLRAARRPHRIPNVKQRHAPLFTSALALAIAASVLACRPARRRPPPETAPGAISTTAPEGETADQFVARVNEEYRALYTELSHAQWLASTYINSDSEAVSAKTNERFLGQLNSWIEQSRKFEGQQMSPEPARALMLLKLNTAMPPPKDPAKLAELTQIATRMEGMYGSGKYCTDANDPKTCRQLGELEDVLRSNRDYAAQLDAWQGWHTVAQPMRKDYSRFVDLVNEGAQRPRLRRHRRDVAFRLRHDAGRDRRGNRSPVGPGQAAVRAVALLHPHQAAGQVRHRQGRRWAAA